MAVLSKQAFNNHLWAVFIDEAYCISLWGGSFWLEYADLGSLWGRLPNHVAVGIASVTLPNYILDDIQAKVMLSKNACVIAMSNVRPNIALSCHPMKFSTDSRADLRFLISQNANSLGNIKPTLVYCNERKVEQQAISPNTPNERKHQRNSTAKKHRHSSFFYLVFIATFWYRTISFAITISMSEKVCMISYF